uniref:NADH-ubiquinone oxidoreductase chain 5 n=1 Tax=Syndesmis echinorum TaxID=2019369 RepID=A0A7G5XUL2_9PLAT|nr:NADH dehydrogenase subunit 5 [Syndesmis echinorum]QNA49647.1 NADH dehydrogenase subunit 5 [Syndesmis echinorum]
MNNLLFSFVVGVFMFVGFNFWAYFLNALNTGVFLGLNFNNLTQTSALLNGGFYLDWVNVLFFFILCSISVSVYWFAYDYMGGDPFFWRFQVLLVLFVSSMVILLFSSNFWWIFLGWDGLGLSSFLLVNYYSASSSWWASIKTYLVNRWGDGFLVVCLCWFLNVQIFSLKEAALLVPPLIFLLLLNGAFTKSAQFPYGSWLPVAMAAPTPVSALIHSSTLVTAGVYLVLRFYQEGSTGFDSVVFLCAFLAVFLGGLGGVTTHDLKKIIAYSTMSQMGFLFIVLLLCGPDLCMMALMFHGIFKAGLFISVGNYLIYGCQDSRLVTSPAWVSCFNVYFVFHFLLSLVGLGPWLGHSSKSYFFEVFSVSFSTILAVLSLIMVMFTSWYSARLAFMVSWGSNGGSFYSSGFLFKPGFSVWYLIFLNLFLNFFWFNIFFQNVSVNDIYLWSIYFSSGFGLIFGLWIFGGSSLKFLSLHFDFVSSNIFWGWWKFLAKVGVLLEGFQENFGLSQTVSFNSLALVNWRVGAWASFVVSLLACLAFM